MARPGLTHYLYDYRNISGLQYVVMPEEDEPAVHRKKSIKNRHWHITYSVYWRELVFMPRIPVKIRYVDQRDACPYPYHIYAGAGEACYNFGGNVLLSARGPIELNLTSTTVIDQVVELINYIWPDRVCCTEYAIKPEFSDI